MTDKKIQYKVLSTEKEGWWTVKFDPQKIEDKLNEMGDKGWDLINSFDINHGNGSSKEIIFILKKV